MDHWLDIYAMDSEGKSNLTHLGIFPPSGS